MKFTSGFSVLGTEESEIPPPRNVDANEDNENRGDLPLAGNDVVGKAGATNGDSAPPLDKTSAEANKVSSADGDGPVEDGEELVTMRKL